MRIEEWDRQQSAGLLCRACLCKMGPIHAQAHLQLHKVQMTA